MAEPTVRRLLLKLSGEALMGGGDFGIDPQVIKRVAGEIRELVELGVQVGVVIGGGNIFRGEGLAKSGVDRGTGDHMGMLATVINSLAMQDALEKQDCEARVMSALRINQVCEDYIRRRAVRHLEKGRVVICAAGTGNPYFSTDSAASLRAIEINADLLIKATKVDGVYSADPVKDPNARFYPQLEYDQVISERLAVMDTAAIILCQQHGLPLRVMNINEPNAMARVVRGEAIGTLVSAGD